MIARDVEGWPLGRLDGFDVHLTDLFYWGRHQRHERDCIELGERVADAWFA